METEAGLYDLVLTYEGKAIGSMLIKFYDEGELSGKSDEELKELEKSF
ncbi:MAG: hypothetical protein IKP95_00650 [Ruminococcus sp.]|nr:hypothetical protein [Ruminococcus sp.]